MEEARKREFQECFWIKLQMILAFVALAMIVEISRTLLWFCEDLFIEEAPKAVVGVFLTSAAILGAGVAITAIFLASLGLVGLAFVLFHLFLSWKTA